MPTIFDDIMKALGIDRTQDNQPVQADDPLGVSDPQFGYRDYTPQERAQEVLYGSLDTAGSMARGVAKAAIEAPRDIYALGSAIGKIQDRTIQREQGQPVKTIGELFTEAYNEAPSFLPDEATAERALPEMTPMSRTYAQDASVYNLPEEFGRIAAPIPLLDYARPSQIAKLGKTAEVTPRILSAANPITGRTGFGTAGQNIPPALEPLREPTMAARYQGDTYEAAAEQYRYDTMSYDDWLKLADERDPDGQLRRSAQRAAIAKLPRNVDTSELAASGRLEKLINDEVVNTMREDAQQFIQRRNEPRESIIAAQRPSYTAEEGRQILIDEAYRKHRSWKAKGDEMRGRGQRQVASFDLPKMIDRIQNATDEEIFTTMKANGLEPVTDKTPAILRDTPKVEKEPPMLRVPAQQARIFNEDGGTGTYSRVEQALLDLKNDPKVTASMTPRQLTKMLEDRGVTKADLQEHGLNLTDYVRKNQHGHDVVDVQKVFDGIEPPQERMGRVILDETGGGDADEMDLQGRVNRGEMTMMEYEDSVGYQFDDDITRYTDEVFDNTSFHNDASEALASVISPDDFQAGIPKASKILGEAKDAEGYDWLDWIDENVGANARQAIEDRALERAKSSYMDNPYVDDTIEFAGEDFPISGNDDIGYVAWHDGTRIIDDVYSLGELEVRIQNWAMDRGYFGHGTGDGAMQWSSYLAGDDKYFEPLEEVILTYDTGTGRVYNPSHEHYGTDIADGYVVHMRTSARETADGKSVYHVDEIQSDLHQDARNQGYISEDELTESNLALAEANTKVDRYDLEEAEVTSKYHDSYVKNFGTEAFERRKQVEPKAKDFMREILKEFSGADDYPTISQLRKLLTYHEDRAISFVDLPETMFRDTPEEFIRTIFSNRTSLAGNKLKKVKEVAKKHFTDPEDKKLIKFYEEYTQARDDVTKIRKEQKKADASYPLKDNRWIKAMVRQAMERAVAKGNFDGITISNPNNPVRAGGSERFMELYKNVYGDRMEKIIKDIGKEYGVTPKKVKLNDPEMQEMGEQWYLPLTKDMIESIRGRGVPLASAAGLTPAILDRINKEREDKTPRILRTA